MFKNTGSQKITVYAVDASTGLPKSGDSANITCYVSKDDGTVTVLGDTSATETEATNAKGDYLFDLTQGETNADKLRFSGKSTTANVVIIPQTIYTVPANFTALGISVAGKISGVVLTDTLTTYTGNTVQTGDSFGRIGALGAGLTAVVLAAAGLNAVLVDGKTLPAALQYIASSTAGKVSGGGTGTEVFLGLDGITTRLTITVDANGNRSAITYG